MKKIYIPLLIIAGFVAIFEQGKEKPNVYIMITAIAVFMMTMMWLTAKTPGKNDENSSDNV